VFDQELSAAKNEGKIVRFTLAAGVFFEDEESFILDCNVTRVDKFMIKVTTLRPVLDRELWIAKAQIVAAEILP